MPDPAKLGSNSPCALLLAPLQALADKVAAIARRKGCTPAQLALAWLLAQGDDIIPIPGGFALPAVRERQRAWRAFIVRAHPTPLHISQA